MLFTSKTNTNETTNTAEETQGTCKMSILKNIAVIAGTAAGIGGVLFGAKKLHDHFSQDYLEDFDDDFDDFFEEDEEMDVTENEAPVEDFTEVDIEETEDMKPVEEMSASEIGNNKSMPMSERISILGDRVKQFKFDIRDGYNAVSDKVNSVSEELFELWRHRKDYQLYNLSLADMKAIDDIIDEFSDEYIKFIETLEEIALHADYKTLYDMKRKFANITHSCWAFVSARCQCKVERLEAYIDRRMFEENLKKSEGETKTSDPSSNETQVEDVKVSGETQTGTREVIPAYKDRTDKQDLRMSLVMDKLGELADRLDEFTTKGFDINTNHMVEIIESFDQEINKTAGITWTTAEEKQVKAYELRLHAAVNLMYDKFVEEIVSSESINTLLEIKAADFEVVRAAYTEMKHVRVPKGFNVHVSTVTRAFEDLRKRSAKPAGETKTSTEPLSYTMAEKVAEAVKAGDEIQAPVTATNASEKEAEEIMRIINDIPNRQTPEKNDLRFLARCIGGHVAKIDISDVSDEMLADLRNSVILFSGMIYTAIEHIAADPASDVFTLGSVQQMRDEFAASNILELIGKDTAKTMLQSIDEEITVFTEKIKSAKAETAATQEPEEPAGLPVDVSNELDNFKKDMEIVGAAMHQGPAKAKEAFKQHLASYLVDPNVSDDIKEQIENVNASITNMKIEEVQTAKKENNAQQSGSKGAKKNKKSSKRHGKR